MYFGKLKFSQIPDIGFALAHYSKNYKAHYGKNNKKTVEIAYINSGEVSINLYKKELIASKGSIIVLFRHLPIYTHTLGEQTNSHYTVLAEFEDYDFELLNEDAYSERDQLIIPFITPPSPTTESIRKKICQIASDMETDREKNALPSAVNFLSILCDLSKERYRMNKDENSSCKKIATSLCNYIDRNLNKSITIEELAQYIGKSPNYTGFAFKSAQGMTITQYVNMQKMKQIAYLMQREKKSFKEACECVAVQDDTYGYRLFKKYMGLTPKEYMEIRKIQRQEI